MQSVRWRRLFLLSAIVGVLVTSVAPSLSVPASAAGTLPAGTSQFVAVAHTRLADTRAATRFGYVRVDTTRTIRVKAAGVRGIPANATAVVVTITTLGSAGSGVVAAYPSNMLPPVDSKLPMNVVLTGAGQSRSNMVTVKLAPNGTFDIRKTIATELVVDVVGAYAPATDPVADGRFVPLYGTHRALNAVAVAAKSSATVDLDLSGVPPFATAAVVNITAERANRGLWTAHARNTTRPATIDLFLDANAQTRSNQTIVPLNGIDSFVHFYSSAGGRVTVDVLGYYTGSTHAVSADGLFMPANPVRRFDSRINRPLAPFGPVTFEFKVVTNPAVEAQGFVANLYSTDSWDAGTVVTRPAGVANASPMPAARIDSPRFTINTAFVGRASNRGVAITANKGAHLVVDLQGYFIGTTPAATVAALKNPTFAPTPVVSVRWKDATGTHVKPVEASRTNTSNDMTRIADKGIAAAFKGMSTLGKKSNTMLFGHRTTHGGMFRYLNSVGVGATFSLKGADGRWYNYRVTRVATTTPVFSNIANMATPYPPVTAQLIACSKRDGTPTSLSYRLVVTGILVSVG